MAIGKKFNAAYRPSPPDGAPQGACSALPELLVTSTRRMAETHFDMTFQTAPIKKGFHPGSLFDVCRSPGHKHRRTD
ncbi:MAG: hypothetical protein Q8N13_05415, partial [Acidovorax sp.]|nr:hypothetical protein [Acidovorax sp.]